MTPAIVSTPTLRRLFGLSFFGAAALGVVTAPQIAFAQSRVSGEGVSKVARDTRKLSVSASVGSSSTGTLRFIHNSPAGLTRFRGQVTCVSSSGGTVNVTGTVEKGETATGVLLDGKAFGFTISTSSSPQTFSLPNFGEAGAIAPCSGGRGESVAVTEDGFRLQ